jgi:hypothetical protein
MSLNTPSVNISTQNKTLVLHEVKLQYQQFLKMLIYKTRKPF